MHCWCQRSTGEWPDCLKQWESNINSDNQSLKPNYSGGHLWTHSMCLHRFIKTGQEKTGKTFPGLMSLTFCYSIQMVRSDFGVNTMKAWIHGYTAASKNICWQRWYNLWGTLSWCTLVPTAHYLNTTAYLSMVADSVHPFMTKVNPSSYGRFQQDNTPCQISSKLELSS